jgi:hypothetical protein
MARRRAENDDPQLLLVRQSQGLVAATSYDLEMLERYRFGTQLHVTVEQPKDDALMRFYRGVVHNAGKAIGKDPDSLHWWLRVEAGLWREIDIFDGSSSIQPLSLRELEQPRFREYVDRAIDLIVTRVIPGADIEVLLKDAGRYVGERTL